MIGLLDHSTAMWRQYWGGSWYPWLLLLAALYLLVFRRKKRAARQLLAFSGGLLFLFFFPPTAWLLQKCVGAEVCWRILWLLPTAPLFAYGATEAAFSLGKNRAVRVGAVAAALLLLAFGGKSVWQAGNYEKVNNRQKVPDEVAQICEFVSSQREEGQTLCLATNDYLAAYIRVYDPSIEMPYSRARNGARDRFSKALYKQMELPCPKIRKVIKLSQKLGVDCLVHTRFTKRQEKRLKKSGYHLAGMVNDKAIYMRQH
ncbi:MAG: hypothetical protein Q4D55_08095 [Eubacteriales bacterium]|nr:hypothetical protein [Eubacteriales bacterium]